MDITAIGPDMWIGKVGHFLILTAFFSALLAAISYWLSAKFVSTEQERSWKTLGRTSFFVHALSVLTVVSLVFYMMATKKYAYSYVYQHASNDLPFKYLFAAFWEGQEGSTMLWAFWHVILGLFLVFTARKWEGPVLGTVSLVQVFLTSMILGVFVFGHRIGISPFVLLKSSATNAPIFAANPNFVPKDGNGLNELLRNYWMVIHPPTVFLGFAAITIPFGYALGGLFWRDLKGWITPVLPWALLAGGVLGLGVLMGGAWAYEALSFGGFWVWDPVENASLVPWLLIVAALHLMLIFRATGFSGLATFLLTILSFTFVAYSTFLTKSGVLGESSVHSFTDLGMSGQLIVFILFFWFVSFLLLLSEKRFRWMYFIGTLILFILYLLIGQSGLLLAAYVLFSFAMIFSINDFPKKQKEEQLWSREFWMFIGSLVLMLSALHIIAATSMPVYNKLFGSNFSMYSEQHFNAVQIWPAMIMLLLSGVVLFFQYNREQKLQPVKTFGIATLFAIAFTILFVFIYNFTNPVYILLLVISLFSFFSNLTYILYSLNRKIHSIGAPLAHIGFALLLAGVVVSQSKKTVVSKNTTANVNVFEDDPEANLNNILLYENEPQQMGEYIVTMKEDVEGKLRDGVVVNFKKMKDSQTIEKDFNLTPKFKNMGENIVADPAIKRGLFNDFFTHISLINLGADIDTTSFQPMEFELRSNQLMDTIVYDRMIFILQKMQQLDTNIDEFVTIEADIEVITKDSSYVVHPQYIIENNQARSTISEIPEELISLRINSIEPENEKVEVGIKSARPFKPYILLKAMIFPMINLVWIGSILMFFGFIFSLIERKRQAKKIH